MMTASRRHVARLLSILALVAAGCTARQADQQDATVQSPREQLQALAKRYAQATTYQDVGELRFLVDEAPENEFRSVPFSVAIERPNKARIHALDSMSVADGETLRASVQSLPGQILARPCPDKLEIASIVGDEMLAQAMRGQLDVDMPQLVLLLAADPLDVLARDCTPVQLADSEFQGKKCRRIALQGPKGKAILWIEQQSGLLVKYEFPLDEVRKKFPLARLWAEFRGARLNEAIAPVAFQMELPSDIKLVKSFVMPPPPEPPALLSKPVGEFTFIGLDGTALGRESLAGKVVVIDLWATWCGWCFEGLPLLEKVYQQYKDRGDVVFLAVSKDDPAVTNAQVEQAFKRHELTVPIARDLEQLSDRLFQLEGLPTTIVLGPDGTVQDYHVGYDPKLAETLPAKIDRLLAGENLAREELERYDAEKRAYDERLSEVLAETGGAPGDEQPAAAEPSGPAETARIPGITE
jgi:thiol-disulfide isomerase/thioredoxin